jgi:hypothetical protein
VKKISKSELAIILGVTRSRVSQLVGAGLPTLCDGKVDEAAALAWAHSNIVPQAGGWRTGVREQERRSSVRRESMLNVERPYRMRPMRPNDTGDI